jgi:hypothetical protein
MALIVEDGTGLANAESYISVADAGTRHSNNGMTNWATLTLEEQEQALRRATQFMEQAFRERWHGYRRNFDQALSWPRWDVSVDEYPVRFDIVPREVAAACADLALKAAAGDLNADLTRGVVREKVGPIETEYDRYSPQAVRYRAIEMTLAPYLKGSNSTVGLVRS